MRDIPRSRFRHLRRSLRYPSTNIFIWAAESVPRVCNLRWIEKKCCNTVEPGGDLNTEALRWSTGNLWKVGGSGCGSQASILLHRENREGLLYRVQQGPTLPSPPPLRWDLNPKDNAASCRASRPRNRHRLSSSLGLLLVLPSRICL